jgi:hypothetical protein
MKPHMSDSLVHITDLTATILDVASYEPSEADMKLDGVSQWAYWMGGGHAAGLSPPRTSLLVNMNSPLFAGSGALIMGDYKYILNPAPKEAQIYIRVRNALAATAFNLTIDEVDDILISVHKEVLGEPSYYLFDLKANPEEQDSLGCGNPRQCGNLYNVSEFQPVQEAIEQLWLQYKAESVGTSLNWEDDGTLANPALFGNVWTPWRDGEGIPKASYLGFDMVNVARTLTSAAPMQTASALVSSGADSALHSPGGGAGGATLGTFGLLITLVTLVAGFVGFLVGKHRRI